MSGISFQARGGLGISQAILASIRRTFRAHLPLYACAGLFLALTAGLFARYHIALPFSACIVFLSFAGQCVLLWVAVLAAIDFYRFWRTRSAGSVSAAIGQSMLNRLLKGERPGNSFHALVVLAPMMMVFAAMKVEIPVIMPFSWDITLAGWDRALGFGRMPWEILQPVLGFAPVTIALNFIYDSWFAVMYAVLLWQGFSPRADMDRLQYLLAFSFAWFFGGSILAIVFSSAGPCFYHYLYSSPSPYAAQLAYLRSIGPDWIWSLTVQDALWQSYKTGAGDIRGISAMPSMHVMIATLLAFFGWRTNRTLGIALSVFATLIVLGSIHLLWHYAVDGIAGAAVGWLCWYIAGVAVRRWFFYVRSREETWTQKIVTTSQSV